MFIQIHKEHKVHKAEIIIYLLLLRELCIHRYAVVIYDKPNKIISRARSVFVNWNYHLTA